ncbi:Rieske 2Fe-2S domain-containing protein [Rhizobium sp. CSW-27]|uniref:Rieske 2Fe-2S domain-containing protein n=1 Tax=Rhizobium sp. CSW-27 TaxID=2839985 RepID=UPI001C024B5C|nr:Rieske 2Fe-2S domain-containing protein [Rhizobium sp. CSW-27]MBT9373204.1 Rieske 2Fe-2S domain-containing protein [Rhizobium sp. CSW-27]
MTARLDQLTAPVEVGVFYLVPTVRGEWKPYGVRDWPVIGPRHNDRHCLNFDPTHYHLDARFMPSFGRSDDDWFWCQVAVAPLQVNIRLNADGLPDPIWKRRKCRRTENPYTPQLMEQVSRNKGFQCLHDEYAGRQAKHDGRGWVCPHRAVPLADHVAREGVIQCPLHLLRIDAHTGKVLPREGA